MLSSDFTALQPTLISTARLRLEPLRVDHAEEMTAVLGSPALHAFTGGEPLSCNALRQRYERQVVGRSADGSQAWLNWIVRLALADGAVHGSATGYVQATVSRAPTGLEAQVAWVTGVPWQRQGIAAEAALALVNWLRARDVCDISANIKRQHLASERVAAHAGLRLTEALHEGERVWRWSAGPSTPKPSGAAA